MENKALVHSVESFGTVDGPGIRFVVFFYGCLLKCLYCHNPDTWAQDRKKVKQLRELSKEELLDEILKVKSFIKGGVTLSGGEALLHAPFLKDFLPLLKQEDIHVALDTAGSLLNDDVKTILKDIDLVLLDIKAFEHDLYYQLTSYKLDKTLEFLDYLKEIKKPTWVRYVLVPNLTDNKEQIEKLAKYLVDFKDIVERVEILPFHKMGEFKWQELGLDYKLTDTKTPTTESLLETKEIFRKQGFYCP